MSAPHEKVGGKIPADGAVPEGRVPVDESNITGPSEPEIRGPGDWVYAGTEVQQGALQIPVDRIDHLLKGGRE